MGINPLIPLWVSKINEPTVTHKDGLEPDKVRDSDPQRCCKKQTTQGFDKP